MPFSKYIMTLFRRGPAPDQGVINQNFYVLGPVTARSYNTFGNLATDLIVDIKPIDYYQLQAGGRNYLAELTTSQSVDVSPAIEQDFAGLTNPIQNYYVQIRS